MVPYPPADSRWCVSESAGDHYNVASAEKEAKRLQDEMNCTPRSSVIDIGCGQGRLAIGLTRVVGPLDYLGVDVDQPSIRWCRRNIARQHPTYRFRHINLHNARYNPEGSAFDATLTLGCKPESFDIAYLYSVFSHTTEQDMESYLKAIFRLLKPAGHLFFTTFAEEDVPPIEINPTDYSIQPSGPLHIVRYELGHLTSRIGEAGFRVINIARHEETDSQTGFLVRKT